MKTVLGLLVVVCGLFAQTAPVEGQAGYQAAFDRAYWASQPPAVRALSCGMYATVAANTSACPAPNASEIALDLAGKGFVIDAAIMVYGGDPYALMRARKDYGLTWVPSALQTVQFVCPGCVPVPGYPAYDANNPPAGSVKVSTDLKDYPPFDPPVVVPTPAVTPTGSYVGKWIFGSSYGVLAGDPAKDGAIVTDPRGKFRKHMAETPFGVSQYYELVVPATQSAKKPAVKK